MKISEIITDKYKLRIPPTVYYELLADIQEVEEEQEPTNKNDLGVEKIIDEIENEFEKVDIPIMDKLTLFAKVQNALYKCAVSNSEIPNNSTTKNDIPHCQYTDEEVAQSFKEDVEAVKDQLPCGEQMDFPNTFDEFAKDYGFKDKDEVYTNGSDLIPVFRVKQWLEHISTTTINGLDDFLEFGKKAFGVELAVKKSDNPDTYEKLFVTTKNDLGVDTVSRKAVHDMLENLPITVEDKWFNWLQKACMRLAELPSVTLPLCADCNSKMDEVRRAYDKVVTEGHVLDKIRAEIMEIFNEEKYVEPMWALGLKYSTHIIDKYKAETEVEE